MNKKKAQSVSPEKPLRSYGRVKGRKLSPRQQMLVDEVLSTITVAVPEEGKVSLESLGQGFQELWLEIGFGGGEHLVHIAEQTSEVLCIGAEPFMNGVAKCLSAIEKKGLQNVRLFPGDVQHLLDALPDACLSRVDILFPDPWPKKSHHKRRLINPVTLSKLGRVMTTGATLWLATDHDDYAAWMLEQLALSPDFDWLAESKKDWQTPPPDWISTRYQQKASEKGDAPVFFKAQRLVDQPA